VVRRLGGVLIGTRQELVPIEGMGILALILSDQPVETALLGVLVTKE
jgi:hypothetical protein